MLQRLKVASIASSYRHYVAAYLAGRVHSLPSAASGAGQARPAGAVTDVTVSPLWDVRARARDVDKQTICHIRHCGLTNAEMSQPE